MLCIPKRESLLAFCGGTCLWLKPFDQFMVMWCDVMWCDAWLEFLIMFFSGSPAFFKLAVGLVYKSSGWKKLAFSGADFLMVTEGWSSASSLWLVSTCLCNIIPFHETLRHWLLFFDNFNMTWVELQGNVVVHILTGIFNLYSRSWAIFAIIIYIPQ